ncbi:TonB-dependent receptor plug domain-containing protein [Marinobacter profundi]|nr:TonB-dependent receptor plug domain-containing protein [Marinobacter profundi]
MTTRRVPPTIISSSLLGCLVLFANPLHAAGTATGDMEAYLASGELSLTSDIPEVLTTTRLRQPKSRVPGTTTIIEGELIRALGIMNLVEVFRLVPGMTVAAVGSNNPVTSYHGTVHYEQRRMQVLVDGRTSYRPNLADVDWNAMPVPLELIERIEVSRGPNAAAYGINAFLATINIITRSPEDTGGTEVRAVSGSRGYLRTFGSTGNASGDYNWRLAYEKRKSDGFDRQLDRSVEAPFHDGIDMNTFTYDSLLALDSRHSLEFRGGVVDGINEEDQIKSGEFGAQADPDITVDDYYLQVRFNDSVSSGHFYHLQASYQNYNRRQRWPICLPPSEILPGAPDEPLFCATLNNDIEESRLELEAQDTLIFNQNLRLISGVGYREDQYESETFFDGRGRNYLARVFGNLEYSPTRWLTLNAGGNWESTTTTQENYFSPRVAANFIMARNHTLRFVYSEAVRTPDAFEQEPDWSYRPTDVTPDLYSGLDGQQFPIADFLDPATSTYGAWLQEERIQSREISYYGQYHLDSALLSLEVRYFNDQLRDMISGIIGLEDWTIDNNVALDQEGFEVEATLDYPGTRLRLSYGYLDQEGTYTGTRDIPADRQQYAIDLLGRLSVRHSGSFAWIQELPFDLYSSAAFYFADEFRNGQFERTDFRLARRVDQPRYSYELAFTVQHYLNDHPLLSPDNIIKERNQFFVEAGVRF